MTAHTKPVAVAVARWRAARPCALGNGSGCCARGGSGDGGSAVAQAQSQLLLFVPGLTDTAVTAAGSSFALAGEYKVVFIGVCPICASGCEP